MKTVLDASAMVAYFLDETGADVVFSALPSAVISTVNIAEVAERLHRDFDANTVKTVLVQGLPRSMVVDESLAIEAGLMRKAVRSTGLSLGDRLCLALARRLAVPVLTADRAWQDVAAAVGVEVRLIR